jgi:AraC-like DNA-binding protein
VSQTSHTHRSGDVIDRHRHEDHQLLYVSDGVVAVRTDEAAWVASADRAIWLPARTWHEHRIYGHSSVHTVTFPVSDAPLSARSPTVVAVNSLIRELLIACTEPGLAEPESRRIRAVLHDRLRGADIQGLILPVARDPRLAHACELVIEDLQQPRPMSWLARHVGASERTLTRLFRAEFGTSYPQWRTNARVFHAMIHLAEGANVTETAHRCGWATTSAFIDTFARTMGQTPGAYRSTAATSAS